MTWSNKSFSRFLHHLTSIRKFLLFSFVLSVIAIEKKYLWLRLLIYTHSYNSYEKRITRDSTTTQINKKKINTGESSYAILSLSRSLFLWVFVCFTTRKKYAINHIFNNLSTHKIWLFGLPIKISEFSAITTHQKYESLWLLCSFLINPN